jgi:putative transposase
VRVRLTAHHALSMPRIARHAPGGQIYRVLNRSVGRMYLFRHAGDFAAFERIFLEAHGRHRIRILSYCLMSNHWHLVVRPCKDGDLTAFFRFPDPRPRHALARRPPHGRLWPPLPGPVQELSHPAGSGGRPPAHHLPLLRTQRADGRADQGVERAEDWRWGSLRVRMHGPKEVRAILSPWPVDRPTDWKEHVNAALTGKEIERLEVSERRGRPYGGDAWVANTVARLGMEHTVRPEGRPRKDEHDREPPSAAQPRKRNWLRPRSIPRFCV